MKDVFPASVYLEKIEQFRLAAEKTMPVPPIPTVIEPDAECRSITDSVGSHSDVSGHTLQASSIMSRPHMDVVCVIDICQSGNLAHRKKALDEVNQACLQVGATLNHIQFEKLDFGEANVISSFYNADMVIVDFSLAAQKSTLSYHLGVRESFNMKHNILLYNDTDAEVTERLKCSTQYPCISYFLMEDGNCVTTGRSNDGGEFLHLRLKRSLQDVEIQSNRAIRPENETNITYADKI